MSGLSIQNTQVYQPIINPITEVKRDFNVEFQRAFKKFDIDQMKKLLQQGASPYQAIELNPVLKDKFLRVAIVGFDRKKMIATIKDLSIKELRSIIKDQQKLNKVIKVRKALKENPRSVPNARLTNIMVIIGAATFFPPYGFNYPKLSAMAFALRGTDLDLMKALVEAGFDFSDSSVVETLVGHAYTVSLRDPATSEIVYTLFLGFTILNHNISENPTLAEFYIEEDQGHQDDLQSMRILQNHGYVLDIKHELGSISGKIDVEKARKFMEDKRYRKMWDFLIEQGVSQHRIFSLKDDFSEKLQLAGDGQKIVDFLKSRGVRVPDYSYSELELESQMFFQRV